MRPDFGKPALDLADAIGVALGLGFAQKARVLWIGLEDGGKGRLLAAGRLLCHPADAGRALETHVARILLQLAADQPQERRLAAAIAADKADLVPGRNMRARPLQERPAADAKRDVVQVQHGAGA
jgi:hypothetical protein